MDGRYIFAIVILGVFFLLILVSFAFLEYARVKNNKLQAWINERYDNKDLNRPDYDHITADDDIFSAQTVQDTASESGENNEDNEEEVPQNIDDSYGKIDLEGIEEITGNYNGDK